MAVPATPSRALASGSSTKPRLLYRGPICLSDGTLLAGVTFLSTVSPFGIAATPTDQGSQGQSTNEEDDDDDAEICLALEMIRGSKVVGLELLDEQAAKAPVANAKSTIGKAKEIDVSYEATGRVMMYIDPREQLTAAFFERHFCWQDDWSTATRSRAIFAVSTLSSSGQRGSSLQATTSTASFDPFSHTYSQPAIGSSSHSAFARKSLQLVLFARLADDTGSHSTSNRSLEILVGRRVVRKRSASISKPRPDDPMPRTSLGELKRESRGSFSAARSSSPADFALAEVKKAAGERKERWKKSMSLPQSRYPLDDAARSLTSRASSVISEEGEQSVRTSLESTARTDGSKRLAAVPGNHTPGRRGEKRHKMNHSASESQLSPTRRRRADDMKLLAPPKRPPERRSSGASDAIKRSGSVSMANSPEPPDTAAFGDMSGAARADDSSASLRSKSDSLLAHGSASNNTKGSYSALETRNRNLIKKLISHQLLGRGLEKGESEYDKCFMATYNGTLCALRHEIGIQDVDRSRAAQVVGSHLNMYLPLGDMGMFTAAPVGSWPTSGNGHGLAPRGNAMEDIKREIKEESGAQSG